MSTAPELMQCVSGFVALDTRRAIPRGHRLPADDPVVKKHPRHFLPEHSDSAAIHQRRVELGVVRFPASFGR